MMCLPFYFGPITAQISRNSQLIVVVVVMVV